MPLSSSMIHPTALLDPTVHIGKDVKIGPYCVLRGHVELGDGVELKSHVAIEGPTLTRIGAGTVIYPFAAIGLIPQDLKYKGESSIVCIGQRTTIREYVTIQPGTEGGKMKTEVGDDCLLMASAHIAHDCCLGHHVIMANNATLAGHVTVENYAIIGGLAAIHQFVRIGEYAIIGGMSGVEHDVIPYGNVKGDRAFLSGVNLVGLKRHGFSRQEIDDIRSVYKTLFSGEGTLQDRIEDLQKTCRKRPHLTLILDFISQNSARSLCSPKSFFSPVDP